MEQYERVLLSMAEDKRYCGENYPLRFIEIMGKIKGGLRRFRRLDRMRMAWSEGIR